MEQIGRFKAYTLEECLDKHFGPKGTSRRDAHERRVEEALHAYQMGEAVKKMRLQQNLTQAELGDKVGVNKAQISKLERGNNIGFTYVGRILNALGIQAPTLDLGVGGKIALW